MLCTLSANSRCLYLKQNWNYQHEENAFVLNPNVFALYLFSLLDVNCIIQVVLEYLHKYDTTVELQCLSSFIFKH